MELTRAETVPKKYGPIRSSPVTYPKNNRAQLGPYTKIDKNLIFYTICQSCFNRCVSKFLCRSNIQTSNKFLLQKFGFQNFNRSNDYRLLLKFSLSNYWSLSWYLEWIFKETQIETSNCFLRDSLVWQTNS